MQIAAALIEGVMPGFEHLRVPEARLIATVHDSIVAELPEDNWEEVAKQCIDRMVNGVLEVLLRLECSFDVPLAAEATIGTRWGLDDIGVIA
jgi:DNA polymerase I-like protein with 3'-5' exonuclease and polymerase domains